METRVIFMGSGEFAAAILKKISASPFRPAAIFTQPDKPVGRKQLLSPSPAKVSAQELGIKIFEPKSLKNAETEKLFESLAPDVVIVADYGKIIPKNLLSLPKYGMLNIHPSLLPCHRGASPIRQTILSGDKETGVSIILMDEQVDHGPIVIAEKFKDGIEGLGFQELTDRLANLGGELILEILPKWLRGEISPQPQDESRATYTKILTRDDGKIDWKKSAQDIERQIRAYAGWPETWTMWPKQNKRIKILKAEIFSGGSLPDNPGTVFSAPDGRTTVACGSGSLVVDELQAEGKNKIGGREFLRGYPEIIGEILE